MQLYEKFVMALATIEKVQRIEKLDDNHVRVTIESNECFDVIHDISQFNPNEGDSVIFVKPDATILIDGIAQRIKSINLNGVWGNGKILNIENYPNASTEIGSDVTSIVGAFKPNNDRRIEKSTQWDKYNIPKTDELNFYKVLNLPFGESVDVTLKIDGQSWSAFFNGTVKGIGSRTICQTHEPFDLNLGNVDKKYNVMEKLERYCRKHEVSLCIRGERFGHKIQKSGRNPHCKCPVDINFFSMFNIDTQSYETKGSQHYIFSIAKELQLPTVEILEENVVFTQELIQKYQNAEKINGEYFEGVVVQYPGGSFKIINRVYDSLKK